MQRLKPDPIDLPLQLLTVSEILLLSDSHGGGFGSSSREFSWPNRIAKALDADLTDYAIDGAVGVFDDMSSDGDGGWNTAWDVLQPARTAAPYVNDWPFILLMLGMNDLARVGGSSTHGIPRIKAMLRGIIGRARCGRIVEDSDTTFITYSTSPAWTNTGTNIGTASGTSLRQATATGAYFEFTCPSDWKGGEVWIGTVTSGGGGGAQFSVTKNGGASGVGPFDNRLQNIGNEIQKILVAGGATGGSYTLTYSGQTTAAISYPHTNSDIQAKLEALSNIGSGNVEVYDIGLAGKYVEFKGTLALTDVAQMTATSSLTGGTPTITISTPRSGASAGRAAGQAWRIPNCAPGDVIRGTVDAITTLFFLDWIGFQSESVPNVCLPLRFRPNSYALWDGTVRDADATALRTAYQEIVAEFTDGKVFTFDGNPAINQTASYFISADFAHLNDSGHEVFATEFLKGCLGSMPRDARSAIVNAQKKSDFAYANTWKQAVRAAAPADISVSAPGSTMDGVTLVPGNRVLLPNQTAQAENGIYIWRTGLVPLIRATDANSAERLRDGTRVLVQEGERFSNREFILYTNGPYTLETTALQFTRTGSRIVELFSSVTNTTTTAANITGLGITVAANETIQFEYVLAVDSSSATSGIQLAVNGPASPTQLTAYVETPSSTSANTALHVVAYDTFAAPTTSPGASVRGLARIKGVFRNGANAGTLIPRFKRSATAATITIHPGSYGEWR